MTRFGLLALAAFAVQAASVRADGSVPSPQPAPPPNLGPVAPPIPDGLKVPSVLTLPPPPAPAPAPTPQAEPQRTQIDPTTGLPARVPRDPPPAPPQRGAPFRSCGSGAGPGLAAIAATWAMLWLGTRFTGRATRRAKNGSTG